MKEVREIESLPYVRWGIAAGVVGAAIVAGFFLIVDLLAGRPLATPTALGASLFLEMPFDLSRSVDALLVAGYSAVHTGVFVGLALVTASITFGRPRRPPTGLGLSVLLVPIFFVGTTLLGFGFGALSGASLWTGLGVVLVTASNLLAACGMTAVLSYAFRTRWTPPGPDLARLEAARRHQMSTPPIDQRQLRSPPSGRMDPTRP